ncbi:MAG: 30S ribosomal protein S3 [Patescibacteria group bacterium]|nr:30S ribosomal protein S3 [Patescibacteria group bacterium]
MTHKVHPKILRISRSEDWLSRGFYKKNFPQYLKENFSLREFLLKKLPARTIESIEIERGETLLKIIIKTARPALIIGRGGEGVERIKKELEEFLVKKNKKTRPEREIKIEIVEVKEPWSSASLASQWVASQIEKRVPYRRCLKMALNKIMGGKGVKGARIEVSGRLDGIEIARVEWLSQGEMPRQNLRAVIDYGFSQAFCTYGVIGVKVWIYKGE